jgi:hypothetical protein
MARTGHNGTRAIAYVSYAQRGLKPPGDQTQPRPGGTRSGSTRVLAKFPMALQWHKSS